MRQKTLVLGGGISALAYLYYNQSAFAAVGKRDEVGGLAATQSKIGPIILWVDQNVEDLLTSLKLPKAKKIVRVGYLVDDQVISGSEFTEDELQTFRDQYSYKTRGTRPKASHMSSGKKEFEIFTIPMDEIVRKLYSAVHYRLITGLAKDVDLYDQIAWIGDGNGGEGNAHEFDQLVSTIPAPIFTKITGHGHLVAELEARDKFYCRVPYDHLPPWAHSARGKFEYAYVASSNDLFHRVKFTDECGILEYTAVPGLDYKTGGNYDTIKHPKGQIIRGSEIFDSLPPYVQLLGRFARWEHGIKFNQVLAQIHANKK